MQIKGGIFCKKIQHFERKINRFEILCAVLIPSLDAHPIYENKYVDKCLGVVGGSGRVSGSGPPRGGGKLYKIQSNLP